MSEKLIRLSNLSMTFEDGETILDGINLYINNKEFLTLLGPSGCGKTTTLRIIGGFLTPTSGDVFFNGQRINDVPSYKRKINTVFQRYALFPHLDVYDNIDVFQNILCASSRRSRQSLKTKNPLASIPV